MHTKRIYAFQYFGRLAVRSLYPIGYTRQAVITRIIGDDLRSSLTYIDCKAANLIWPPFNIHESPGLAPL